MPSKPSGIRVFKLGEMNCHVLYDGSRSIGTMTSDSPKRFIFGDAPEKELNAYLSCHGGLDFATQIPFNYLMVVGGGHTMLLDTGCGAQAENNKHPDQPAGLLIESLGEAGFDPREVDTVIVSHWHWDHFGGAVANGEASFPNAEYLISEMEAEYIGANVKGWAQDYIQILGNRLRLVKDNTKLNPGITLKTTPGHTPGLIVTEITSGTESLQYISDLFLHKAHFEHPRWIPSFETDKAASEVSRRRLIEDAYVRKLRLFVPHFIGVLGHIDREGLVYKWVEDSTAK